MNLTIRVIEELLEAGVREFVVCPGGRNASFADHISTSGVKHIFWPEERSAAFFALGRARATESPVAIVVTSGTAAAELLPALMEAYYTSTPLIAVTADRPRRYRGCNAPQAAEQVGLFGIYTPLQYDLEADEHFSLTGWSGRSPVHLNVCLEEPKRKEASFSFKKPQEFNSQLPNAHLNGLDQFLMDVDHPLVVLGALRLSVRETVTQFLVKLNAPVYLEGQSGLRTDRRLAHLRVYDPQLKEYDGVLRIGGIPTHRIWRELEGKKVCSLSEHPFSGLPGGQIIHTCLDSLKSEASFSTPVLQKQIEFQEGLLELFKDEPLAEATLIYQLSTSLPEKSLVYLGNSLPIREWDLAATYDDKQLEVQASRGLNGIDGQLSCFFGLCQKERLNVALLGDLTLLYDLVAPWCLKDLSFPYALVLINNGGGKIFSRLYDNPAIQNLHHLNFAHFAKFWQMPYQEWREVPAQPKLQGLIELVPDPAATDRFNAKLDALRKQQVMALT